MIYLQLLRSFLQVGLFSIGGGYATMPLIQNQVVSAHAWLTMNEFTDLITIAEMTPGPIAAALVLLRWKKRNPILVMVLCGIIYLAVHLFPGAA